MPARLPGPPRATTQGRPYVCARRAGAAAARCRCEEPGDEAISTGDGGRKVVRPCSCEIARPSRPRPAIPFPALLLSVPSACSVARVPHRHLHCLHKCDHMFYTASHGQPHQRLTEAQNKKMRNEPTAAVRSLALGPAPAPWLAKIRHVNLPLVRYTADPGGALRGSPPQTGAWGCPVMYQ